MAKVDVLIPAYNSERTIETAIRSVLAQTEPDLRLIVVDDGSTDSTAALVETLVKEDRRITFLRKENGGVVEALNTGVALLEAPFFARLDSDDVSAVDRLERQLAHFERQPDLVATSGGHQEIDIDGNPTGFVFQPEALELADPTAIPAREPQLIHSFLTMRTQAFLDAGGYRPFVLSEDTDLFWRLLETGPVAITPGILGQYRLHLTSLSSRDICNVRILAASSQLAAISTRRRKQGQPDIQFLMSRDQISQAATSIFELATSLSQQLNRAERDWFNAAVSAKLMELAGYRPVELSPEDCRFIASGLGSDFVAQRPEAAELSKMKAATAARLFRLGRMRSALSLTDFSRIPEIALRSATGRYYWRKRIS